MEKRGKIKRCIHSHFKEYKSKGNRAFLGGGGGGGIQREIELAHYTLATLW